MSRDARGLGSLGSWVVPFCPFYFRVPFIKLNIRKKGTLIVKGLLRNLGLEIQGSEGLGHVRELGFRACRVHMGLEGLGLKGL